MSSFNKRPLNALIVPKISQKATYTLSKTVNLHVEQINRKRKEKSVKDEGMS